MRINFYKLFFTFLFIMMSGVGFAQTTLTFDGSAYRTESSNYYGKNLDFAVGSKTLRFNYYNSLILPHISQTPSVAQMPAGLNHTI